MPTCPLDFVLLSRSARFCELERMPRGVCSFLSCRDFPTDSADAAILVGRMSKIVKYAGYVNATGILWALMLGRSNLTRFSASFQTVGAA